MLLQISGVAFPKARNHKAAVLWEEADRPDDCPEAGFRNLGGSLCDLIIPKKDNLKDKIEADCKRAKGEQLMKLRPN